MNLEETLKSMDRAAADFKARVRRLIAEGRSYDRNEYKPPTSRDEEDEQMIRLVFWRLYRPDPCQHDRESTPDERLVSAIMSCISESRDFERRRLSTAVATGIQKALGDEAESLVYTVADAMGLFDR